ncbi:glycoside hydrolase [Pseudovirgaria hyperparasitica]|uniref:cellulase n=1 Tax=Pseudovirgaria hyperparasitica TaxID=470096 RepID=A0A6A6W9G7_9PEZI|nr:glycoside hydrolase [Pseudovirgaria hyperparasitica]KAF2758237.1 glycoside hydrolase [Pseudovirgaria hyperparasitica]
MHSSSFAVVLIAVTVPALAQSGAWAQCGGDSFSGPKTCTSGYYCAKLNDFYSQCQPGAAISAPASAIPALSSTSSRVPWWFGINLSGAEFGEGKFPGDYGIDYTWYNKSTIDTLISVGINHLRVNFLMERLTPGSLTGAFDPYYLGNLTDQIDYITSKGAYAMVQPHNYGRFYDEIITDTAGFKTWWLNVARLYKDNDKVVFDINNEFYDMDQQLVFELNQAGIDGIRGAGANKQWITPEGNSWTAASTWVSSGNGASLVKLVDPSDKLIYQMHLYLDTDASGNDQTCVSGTIFEERLVAATTWLRENKKLGLIGEFAGGANELCIQAFIGGLKYLKANRDVWTGHMWWAAGPWWDGYPYSMEPLVGIAYTDVLPKILPYV